MLVNEIFSKRELISKSIGELIRMLKLAPENSSEYKEITKAIASKEKQIAKAKEQGSELQQVVKGIEQDPEKIALQKQIQSFRGELNRRKRDSIKGLEELKKEYEKLDTEAIQDLMRREKRKNGESDFFLWLKDIVDDRIAKQDALKSVSGNIKQGTSVGTQATGPWAQLNMTREKFRKILQNPQDPRHAEVKRLWAEYKASETK